MTELGVKRCVEEFISALTAEHGLIHVQISEDGGIEEVSVCYQESPIAEMMDVVRLVPSEDVAWKVTAPGPERC